MLGPSRLVVEEWQFRAGFSAPPSALWIADFTLSPPRTWRVIRNKVCTYPCSTVWHTYTPASEPLTCKNSSPWDVTMMRSSPWTWVEGKRAVLSAIYGAAHHRQMLWIISPCKVSPNSPPLSHPQSGRTRGPWLEVTEGHTPVRCCCSPPRTPASPHLGAIVHLYENTQTQTRKIT